VEIVSSQINGDVVVAEDTQFNNINCDSIVIPENVIARLFGIIKGDITIKKGATGYLHGKIGGRIVNEGGVLYIFLPSGKVESH